MLDDFTFKVISNLHIVGLTVLVILRVRINTDKSKTHTDKSKAHIEKSKTHTDKSKGQEQKFFLWNLTKSLGKYYLSTFLDNLSEILSRKEKPHHQWLPLT